MQTGACAADTEATAQESIDALLAKYPGERDTKKLIRRLAREKVAYAKSKMWMGPPFCPKEFTSIFGIRCKEVSHDIGGCGRILLKSNGKLWIEYRSGELIERQRFTILHEFAHTLFPNYSEFLPYHHSVQDQLSPSEKKFEYLCDLAAAEMLLPFDEFSKDLGAIDQHGFETVHELRKRYLASIDATTYRLIELSNAVGCAAVFLTDQKGSHIGRGPLWVKNASQSEAFKSYIKPGTMPPNQSVVFQCYSNHIETTTMVRETWWINGKPRTWLVQATKLPSIPENPFYPKVVALIFPSGYKKEQIRKLKSDSCESLV